MTSSMPQRLRDYKGTVDLWPLLAGCALAALLLVDGFYQLFRAERLRHGVLDGGAVKVQPIRDGASERYAAQRTIIAAHLFGVAPQVGTSATTADVVALTLTGIIAWRDPHLGFAIIGDKKLQSSHSYTVGALLPNGAHISEIYADRVVTERNGTVESLRLPRGARSGLQRVFAWTSPIHIPVGDPSEDDVTTDPGEFSRARSWFNGFGARPYFPQGDFVGFRAEPLPRYARDFGVQSGDVITAINGVTLDGPNAAAAVLQRATGDTVTITVERDGVSQDLELTLDPS